MPPHSFNKIHSLHLDIATLCNTALATERRGCRVRHYQRIELDHGRWATLWDTVAAMKGLENLHVKLTKLPHVAFSNETISDILEPFMSWRGLREFSVLLSWELPEQVMKSYIDKAPFDLTCASKDV